MAQYWMDPFRCAKCFFTSVDIDTSFHQQTQWITFEFGGFFVTQFLNSFEWWWEVQCQRRATLQQFVIFAKCKGRQGGTKILVWFSSFQWMMRLSVTKGPTLSQLHITSHGPWLEMTRWALQCRGTARRKQDADETKRMSICKARQIQTWPTMRGGWGLCSHTFSQPD